MDPVDLALLVLRVGVGVTMFLHGANKVRGGLAGAAGWFASMGVRPGLLNARMAAGSEIVGGLAFAVGFATPLAAAAIVGTMVVAGITAHRDKGFFIFNPDQGWEYVFVLAIATFTAGATGPGRISVDALLGIGDAGLATSWWWAAIAGVGGVGGGLAHLAVFWRPGR
ncbi:MAG: DoxX family protein [Actinobacteria bacterium]|nr:DoxX family protein [Actinomycetota bacterium]